MNIGQKLLVKSLILFSSKLHGEVLTSVLFGLVSFNHE
jgi:hypothetical protein